MLRFNSVKTYFLSLWLFKLLLIATEVYHILRKILLYSVSLCFLWSNNCL